MEQDNTEEVIDKEVTQAVEQVLKRLQFERDRIVALAREKKATSPLGTSINFCKSDNFIENLSRLLATPFGDIQQLQQQQQQHQKQQSAAPDDDKTRITNRRRKISKNSYDNMEVVAVVKGNDLFGDPIEKPSAIVQIPDSSNFAVMHSDRISFLSHVGKLMSTYKILTNAKSSSSVVFTWPYLVADPVSRLLFFTDRGQIKSIECTGLNAPTFTVGGVFAKQRIEFTSVVPCGLALSMGTRQMFTAIGKNIFGFSLSTWSATDRAQIVTAEEKKACMFPKVRGVRDWDKKLVYSDGNGKALVAVPISSQGELLLADSNVICKDVSHHSAITFDSAGNILIAQRSQFRIEILSPNGDETFATVGLPSAGYGSFSPTDIAVMTAPNGGEAFSFGNDLRCSCIVATPDYAANRIVYFGSPIDE